MSDDAYEGKMGAYWSLRVSAPDKDATVGNGPKGSQPWEEAWHVDDECVWESGTECDPIFLPGHEATGPRARLAAAAPDLVRALLAVEWVRDGGGDMYRCPFCDVVALMDTRTWEPDVGHHEKCIRQAALRKAGVIE